MALKVIYVSWVKLTHHFAENWYIDHLITNNIEVEYWDATSFTRGEHAVQGELNADYLTLVKSYSEFEKLVQREENNNAIYVMMMLQHFRHERVFRILSRHNCKMVFIDWGAMPVNCVSEDARKLWLHRAFYGLITSPFKSFRNIFDQLAWKVYKKLRLIKPFEVVFSAGSVIIGHYQFAKKVVPINICDYDHYQRAKTINERIVKEKYVVFIDNNEVGHPDNILSGEKSVNYDSYYKSLNNFFDLVEARYGVKVVIAAHPSLNVETSGFNKRSVFKFLTAELIKDAQFALVHHSTAVSYAVLNLKPCLFIYTNDLENLDVKVTVAENVNLIAKSLDSAVYNVDQIQDSEQIIVKQANSIRYEEYKYRFLTSKESEEEMSQDIFLREIKSL